MNDVDKNKVNKTQLWNFALFMWNSDVLLQGLKKLTEHHLHNDRLPLSYFFLIGVVTSIVAVVINWMLRKRSLRVKIACAGILLVVVVVTCIWMSRSVD